jgi:TRAP transporter TAXI family solute receptor
MKKLILLSLVIVSMLLGAEKWQKYGFNYNYDIGIMTGGIGGTYIKFGIDCMKLMDLKNSNILIRPIISKGSQINMIALRESPGVDLAIIQSDVMEAYKNSGKISNMLKELRYISFLYNEEVHIISLKNSSFKYVKDLSNKKVIIGPKGSGTELTSNNIFSILELNIKKLNSSYDDAFKKLLNHQIDAIVLVGGKPLSKLKPYLNKIKFLRFTKTSLNLLSKVYIKAELSNDDYSNIDQPIKTIGVPSILVAYNWTQGNNIKRYNGLKKFVNVFFENLDTFKQIGLDENNKKWQQINPLKKVPGWKRHKVVIDYILNQY